MPESVKTHRAILEIKVARFLKHGVITLTYYPPPNVANIKGGSCFLLENRQIKMNKKYKSTISSTINAL